MTMEITKQTSPCGDPTCRDGYCSGHTAKVIGVETSDLVSIYIDDACIATLWDWDLSLICSMWQELSGATAESAK